VIYQTRRFSKSVEWLDSVISTLVVTVVSASTVLLNTTSRERVGDTLVVFHALQESKSGISTLACGHSFTIDDIDRVSTVAVTGIVVRVLGLAVRVGSTSDVRQVSSTSLSLVRAVKTSIAFGRVRASLSGGLGDVLNTGV